MYSLDVNFLKDRAAPAPGERPGRAAPKQTIVLQDMLPAIIGGGVGLGLMAIAGIAWGVVTWQQRSVQTDIDAINAEIAQKQPLVDQVRQLEAQIALAERQTAGLATVFQQILPWSAILQDIRDRVPAGVSLSSVVATETMPDPAAQQAAAAAAAAPADPNQAEAPLAAPPALPPTIDITGIARSFNDVNDFMLTLGQSFFLEGDTLKLLQANLQQPTLQVEGGGTAGLEIDEVANFSISIEMADLQTLPVADLRRELTRKGALGLTIRLDTLETQGIIGTQAATPEAQPAQPIIDPNAAPNPIPPGDPNASPSPTPQGTTP